MPRIPTLVFCLVVTCLVGARPEAGRAVENWPQFRGPGARGVAANHARLPAQWSTTDNVRWKRELPGRGWSSPITWGNRVFLTSAVTTNPLEDAKKGLYFGGDRSSPPDTELRWVVLCLNTDTGEPLWEKEVATGKPPSTIHIKNSFASETPTTDGERVYAYFGCLGVFCFDLEGNPIWERRWPPRPTRFGWGTAASPVLHGERLYIVNDNEEESTLVALDKRTGDEIWRVPREEKSNWSTPFIWENPLRTEIITPGTGKTRAYDLDGQLLYEFSGASAITIATPYSAHGLLYVSSGYILDPRKPIWAIKPGGAGDITLAGDQTSNDAIAWCSKRAAPYNPSTLVYEDLLYALSDRGLFACHDARTGEEIYSKERLPEGRAFTASPWAYNGLIFCANEYGETYVIQAGREFKLLHQNKLEEDDMIMATPAVSGDRLLIRTDRRLYCLQASAPEVVD